MIGFFIKKNFFDGWENIFTIFISNLITILWIAFCVVCIFIWGNAPANSTTLGMLTAFLCFYVFIFFAIMGLFILIGAFAQNAFLIADFKTPSIKSYFINIFSAVKNYFKFGCLISAIIIAVVVGLPIYIRMDSFYGVMLAMILLFAAIIVCLALQWYIPLSVLIQGDFKKLVKKSFVVLFDNFAFSIFMAIYSIFLLALSVVCFFTIPGLNGILLAQVNALRLRLLKYDWLDQHVELKVAKERKNIPWEALLKEDESMLGKKSFKTLFMPWKADHED